MTDLRTRIDQIEENAVESFNEHMVNLLEILEYENLDWIWIDRSTREAQEAVALSTGVIGQELFSVLVFTAILTTTLVPVTVKWGVDWLARSGELIFIEDPEFESDSEST